MEIVTHAESSTVRFEYEPYMVENLVLICDSTVRVYHESQLFYPVCGVGHLDNDYISLCDGGMFCLWFRVVSFYGGLIVGAYYTNSTSTNIFSSIRPEIQME